MGSQSEGLITGPLDGYDYLTFVVGIIAIVALFYFIIQIGGLPGKLAERRNHPHADSVKLLGWIGLFTALPWIHALIWSFHDSLTIDIRRFPKEEREAVERERNLGLFADRRPKRSPENAAPDAASPPAPPGEPSKPT